MTLSFAPDAIETWPLSRLQPYAKNAKVHGPDQVAKIAASMAEFGWTVPCMVADDGELIAGHGRVLAATMLGLTEVPVIRLSHLDEAERRAYRIADNKLTELGGWDEALLLQELQALLNRQQRAAQNSMVGRTLGVLFEKPGRKDGQMIGKSDYLHSVFVDAPQAQVGDLVRVRIVGSAANSLHGELAG